MPNYIKYSTNTQTLALKSGNYYIGTGDVRKGPTSTTDYWSCVIPPTSGYTVYLNKASNGPSIYTCNNDTDLINITNRIASQSYTSATECLVYYLGQNDKLCANIDYPTIVTNGLVLNLDAGFVPSYPRTATTWYDLSGNGNNGTLVNGPTFNSANEGSIVFDGTNDYVSIPDVTNVTDFSNTQNYSVQFWFYATSNPTEDPIVEKWNGVGGYPYVFRYSNNGTIYIALWNGTTSNYSGVISITLNSFHNICGVFSWSTNLLLFYINGVLQSSTALNLTGTITNSSPLYLFHRGGSSLYTSGRISMLNIYNRALSATEVLQNYNATKSRFGL